MLEGIAPGQRRMANLTPLTDKQLRDAERDKVYIFNVSPKEHRLWYKRQYIVPARSKDGVVSEPLVIPGTVFSTWNKPPQGLHVDYEWLSEDGIDVAKELLGLAPMLDPSQNMLPYGLFMSMSPEPDQEAIDSARERWINTCYQKVAEGDRLASVNNGIVDIGGGRTASNISKDHREALEETGLKRSWGNLTPQKMLVCEECGESNQPSAARCKNPDCRCIFDEAKCRQRFPEMFAHETGRGRPRKDEQVAA